MADYRLAITTEQFHMVWNIFLKTFLVARERNTTLTIDTIRFKKSKNFTDSQGWKENAVKATIYKIRRHQDVTSGRSWRRSVVWTEWTNHQHRRTFIRKLRTAWGKQDRTHSVCKWDCQRLSVGGKRKKTNTLSRSQICNHSCCVLCRTMEGTKICMLVNSLQSQ